jgi:hypothetical protein
LTARRDDLTLGKKLQGLGEKLQGLERMIQGHGHVMKMIMRV